MTLEEREDRAAEELSRWRRRVNPATSVAILPSEYVRARAAIRAAFPELFTDPPTAWIAPWEMTDGMHTAAVSNDYPRDPAAIEDKWVLMRDSHLSTLKGEKE